VVRMRPRGRMPAVLAAWIVGVLGFALCPVAGAAEPAGAEARWTEAKAQQWYEKQPWLVGANFTPADAINQLEMWQAETFDPQEIDKELGWAEGLGMNTMRVFLHDQLWQQDAPGFRKRIDTFLSIAAKHHIKPMLVLFDSCWDPEPRLGPQRPPIPGVHNSGWVQSPGTKELEDANSYPKLKEFVEGVVGAFANDDRILAWDVWNEPDNEGGGNYGKQEPKDKAKLVAKLLPQVFAWARAEHPVQPLTSPLWTGGKWDDRAELNAIERTQIEESDVISFHNYGWPEEFAQRVHELERYHRPLICTEYMARPMGSTFDTILPLAKQLHVAAINWGFVQGKTQTYIPWDSWKRPYVQEDPPVWFHDVLYADGRPYREREVEILRRETGARAGAPSAP
jgi:Cellulase (glycosyl hydrolase family 5)